MKDDILGLYGDEKKLGKSASSDLKEGKRTLLILKALENSNNEQKIIIQKALGNKNITITQLNQVRDIVKQTGSLEYSNNLITKLIIQAKSELKKTKLKKQGKLFIIDIANYLENREY